MSRIAGGKETAMDRRDFLKSLFGVVGVAAAASVLAPAAEAFPLVAKPATPDGGAPEPAVATPEDIEKAEIEQAGWRRYRRRRRYFRRYWRRRRYFRRYRRRYFRRRYFRRYWRPRFVRRRYWRPRRRYYW